MENKAISMIDILIQTHAGLEQQGSGSPEMTFLTAHSLSKISPK